jgi:hypothetical protein
MPTKPERTEYEPVAMSLVVEAVWDDPDMLEVRVAVSNSSFSGQTNVYVGLGDLAAAADHLAGFPTSPGDERRVSWGSEEPGSRLGQVKLLFRCRTGAGHPVLAAEVRSSDLAAAEPGQIVRLQLPFDAAGMDRFVEALRAVERARRGTAVLEGAA